MPATDIRTNLNNFIDEYLIFVPDSSSLISGLGSTSTLEILIQGLS